MFGSKLPFFMDAFNQATKHRYSYLLIDISPHSESQYELRTYILPNQTTIAYAPVKK